MELTLSVDDEVLRHAQVKAESIGTNVPDLVCTYLERFVDRSFFDNLSIGELAAAQNIGAFDANKAAGGFPADEDADEFVQTIYEARK